MAEEEVGFVPEEISEIIKESVDGILQNQAYNEQKVGDGRPAQVPILYAVQDRSTSSSFFHGKGEVQQHTYSNKVASNIYSMHLQVSCWTSQCLESCMKRLGALNKPYKYVVTCIIMQKTGQKNGVDLFFLV